MPQCIDCKHCKDNEDIMSDYEHVCEEDGEEIDAERDIVDPDTGEECGAFEPED